MKTNSIKTNFVMNIFLSISSFIFPLVTFPYVARVLLPTGTGKVNFATSVISYFLMFAQMGAPSYGIRACAKVRDNKKELTRTAHELLIINLVMSLIAYILLAISIMLVPKFRTERDLLIVLSSTILLTALGMEWLYKALEQYTYITIRSIIFKFIAVLTMFLLVHKETDYIIYGGITILAASASNILNFANAHKYIGFRPVGGYNFRRHFRPILVFFAMACATTIYTNLDNVMLGFMTNDAEVGLYGTAIKVKTLLVSVVTALGAVILPRASYYVEQGRVEEFRKMITKAVNFVLLLATPLTAYFIVFAPNAVLLLSGDAFTGAIIPMQIIMPTLLLIGLSNIMGIQILVPTGREKIVLYSEIAGAIIDIVLNALLIPIMQAAGAAIGTLVAELVVLAVQYYALRNEVREIFMGLRLKRMIIAIALGLVLSSWVLLLDFGDLYTLLISGPLFFITYGIFLLLKKEPLIVEIYAQFFKKVAPKAIGKN